MLHYAVVARSLFEAQEIARYNAKEIAEQKAQLLNKWTRRPSECLPLYRVIEIEETPTDHQPSMVS